MDLKDEKARWGASHRDKDKDGRALSVRTDGGNIGTSGSLNLEYQ
jgi:hypothetical protein